MEYETEQETTCPNCNHTWNQELTIEIDLASMAESYYG